MSKHGAGSRVSGEPDARIPRLGCSSFAPKGQPHPSPGQRPGFRQSTELQRALERATHSPIDARGEPNLCRPFQGLPSAIVLLGPRALPWADMSLPLSGRNANAEHQKARGRCAARVLIVWHARSSIAHGNPFFHYAPHNHNFRTNSHILQRKSKLQIAIRRYPLRNRSFANEGLAGERCVTHVVSVRYARMSSRAHRLFWAAVASSGLAAIGATHAPAQAPQGSLSMPQAAPPTASAQSEWENANPAWSANAYPATVGSGPFGLFGPGGRFGTRIFGGDVAAPPSMMGATGPGGSSTSANPFDGSGAAGAGTGTADTGFGGGSVAAGLGGGLSGGGGNLTMLGDQGPFSNVSAFQVRQPGLPPPGRPPVPGQPGQGLLRGAVLIPSIRNFKVSDNQSPRPQDRIYFSFSFFDDVNSAINQRRSASVSNMRVFRETFGFRKDVLGSERLHWPATSSRYADRQ